MQEENTARIAELEEENEKLRRALLEIKEHLEKIEAVFESLGDLAIKEANEDEEPAAATDDEIKDLLKKYSRL